MAKNKNKGNAAAQVAAAPAETQTVATATTSTETANAATVATTLRKKMPPKRRVPAAEKAPKEAKRVTGVLVHIALVSYNHWRSFVNEIINGEDKNSKKLARFVKDASALNTKWGGYIGVATENVDAVVEILSAYTAANNAKPVAEQVIDMWQILEHFQTVEPKPRARKAKATPEANTSEAPAATETATETVA